MVISVAQAAVILRAPSVSRSSLGITDHSQSVSGMLLRRKPGLRRQNLLRTAKGTASWALTHRGRHGLSPAAQGGLSCSLRHIEHTEPDA